MGACLAFAGCVPINRLRIDNSFKGLDAALIGTARSGGVLRVLVVHGMNNHRPGYSDPLFARLAPCLRMHETKGSEVTNSITSNGRLFGYLRMADYAGGRRKMRVYEVTWSPITYRVKLAQFALDQSLTPKRQWLNGMLKSGLMDTALSDAVLYTGSYRKNMQFPIQFGIKRLLDDGVAPRDQVCFITYSLGSYMTFDTLRSLRRASEAGGRFGISRQQVDRLARQTTRIYMLANQLPLLELTELSQPVAAAAPHEAPPTRARLRALLYPAGQPPKLGSPLRDFIGMREPPAGKAPGAKLPLPKRLQIVAFSDPNDLLSFPLEPRNYTNSSPADPVTAANVNIIIAHWSLFGIVSNPAQAHDGWDNDRRAVHLIAFGGKATSRAR